MCVDTWISTVDIYRGPGIEIYRAVKTRLSQTWGTHLVTCPPDWHHNFFLHSSAQPASLSGVFATFCKTNLFPDLLGNQTLNLELQTIHRF